MPEVKYNFSPRFAKKLHIYVYRTKLLPKISICCTKFIKKNVLAVIAILILLNIVTFITLTYNYRKTVWSKKNYDTIVFWRPLR